eukprot:CAMPEP_0174726556 /NCGR_PEP_ID=MMETSP1094-20130205/48056_1 /TAXON_ID=156173 /ORGANISM="Chrysochromulina brevifilum, Strain UTEX LB 985" /LENGTH=54 /DNA_ID=CAMNT_0015928155 /DNA_START=123 /DNA_END=284 /DNA_ORIENTATION=-
MRRIAGTRLAERAKSSAWRAAEVTRGPPCKVDILARRHGACPVAIARSSLARSS